MIRGVVAYPIAASEDAPRRLLLGPENAVLRAALDAFLADPGAAVEDDVNPLVIAGPSGVGKSSVLDVAAAAFSEQPVLRWTGADWCRSYACAVDTDGLDCWREKCRSVACLMLDALEQTDKKTAAQQELCMTLDARREAGLRTLITCGPDPLNEERFSPRLRGRLAAGLVAPTAPPGREVLRGLLEDLASQHCLDLPGEVADTLLESLRQSALRQGAVTHHRLRHALVQLKLLAEHQRRSLDADLARQAAGQPAAENRPPSIKRIHQLVGRYFGYRAAELRGPGRQRGVVRARSLAMYLARRLTDHTLAEIGQFFGGRDHTTVMHACQKIQDRLPGDPELSIAVQDLLEQLQPAGPAA